MQLLESPDKTLLKNLEKAMAERGWKKSDLARAAGLPISTIYPLFDERQLAWPQPQTLARLADGLETTVSALLSSGGVPARRQPTPQEALAVIARELETHRETPARDPLAERVAKLRPEARAALEGILVGLEEPLIGEEAHQEHGQAPAKRK